MFGIRLMQRHSFLKKYEQRDITPLKQDNERVQRVNKILLFYHIFFLLYRQEYSCTNNSVKEGNDVIDILTN